MGPISVTRCISNATTREILDSKGNPVYKVINQALKGGRRVQRFYDDGQNLSREVTRYKNIRLEREFCPGRKDPISIFIENIAKGTLRQIKLLTDGTYASWFLKGGE